jgi:hypothetical protein
VENFCDDLYHMIKLKMGLWAKTHFYFVYLTVSPLVLIVSS